MGKRKFTIFVYEDVDWEIRLKGIDYNNYPPLEYDDNEVLFGIAHGTKDNKIVYLFDIAFSANEDNYEKMKFDDKFTEICIFKDKNSSNTFESTFIEAMEYCKKKIHEFRNERE